MDLLLNRSVVARTLVMDYSIVPYWDGGMQTLYDNFLHVLCSFIVCKTPGGYL